MISIGIGLPPRTILGGPISGVILNIARPFGPGDWIVFAGRVIDTDRVQVPFSARSGHYRKCGRATINAAADRTIIASAVPPAPTARNMLGPCPKRMLRP